MMPTSSKTIVYLNADEALLFIEFQKRYALVKALESIGAFNLKNGSVILNFDSLGQIGSIERREHFKLGSPQI